MVGVEHWQYLAGAFYTGVCPLAPLPDHPDLQPDHGHNAFLQNVLWLQVSSGQAGSGLLATAGTTPAGAGPVTRQVR